MQCAAQTKMNCSITRLFSMTSAAALAVAAVCAVAQPFPAKPVRFIVPYAAGGGVDIVTRTLAQKLTEIAGQSFVVDNRPGGNANIASEAVARAAPDGYTLLMGSPANAVNGSLFSKLPYDTLRDFAPVALVGYGPLVLVVHPSVPAHTVKELIALCKARAGQINYASGGNGTSQHLAGELLRVTTGISVVHVPYKGAAPALVDLIGGQIAFMFNNTLEVLPYAKSGRLRALAMASAQRAAVMPDVPTFAEAGYKGFEATVWWGVLAPAATPKDVIARLNADIGRALRAPDMKEKFTALGAEITGGTPEQYADFLKNEITKWAGVIKASGIRAD
jgi:tripartite-type tricarboxylate transporter receptor subunit TctC